MNKFLKECFLQKTNQFEALRILNEDTELMRVLKLGSELTISFDKATTESSKKEVIAKTKTINKRMVGVIGVISDEDAQQIKPFLEQGWDKDLFECRVSKFDEKADDENKRISIAIFIKDHNNHNQ